MKNADNKIDKSHRGEVIYSIIKNKKLDGNKITLVWLAQKLDRSRKTIENWLDKHDLDADKIREIGRAINHDFSIQFPELKNDLVWTLGAESEIYGRKNPAEELVKCRQERDRVKDLYIEMLEKYNSLQEEFFKLKLQKASIK